MNVNNLDEIDSKMLDNDTEYKVDLEQIQFYRFNGLHKSFSDLIILSYSN